MLQKARETVIAYQRLNSEMQKKEILLNCISEEMNAALANVITSLRLIELEKNPARITKLLSLAMRGTEEQQALINQVLTLFAAELAGLYGRDGARTAEARVGEALRAAEENVTAQFAEKQVRLSIADGGLREARVSMDSNHLVRVLSSLLENGLQNAPASGEVQLHLGEEPEVLLIQVFDNGVPLPPDVCKDLFFKFGTTETASPAASLPLQFCRIAIENCHGQIGYSHDSDRGNCFSIRLPKSIPAK
jgi:K+-sensing histidine kinase KdpD